MAATRAAQGVTLLADNGVPWALADLALHLGQLLSVRCPVRSRPRKWPMRSTMPASTPC